MRVRLVVLTLISTLAAAGANAQVPSLVVGTDAFAAFKQAFEACQSKPDCMLKLFDTAEGGSRTSDINSQVSFPANLFKSTTDNFIAVSEGYRYREVEDGTFQYQIGFGYRVLVKQKDANLDVVGTVQGVPFDVAPAFSGAMFSAKIIGIGMKGAAPADKSNLFAQIPTNPAVSPTQFARTADAISSAVSAFYGGVSAPSPDTAYSSYVICPQVINVRHTKDFAANHAGLTQTALTGASTKAGSEPNTTLQGEIQRGISALGLPACNINLPNALMLFSESDNSESVTVIASASIKGQRVHQRYARRASHLFNSKDDAYIDAWITGGNDSVSAGSLLGALVTASGGSVGGSVFFVEHGISSTTSEPTIVVDSTKAASASQLLANMNALNDTFSAKKSAVDAAALGVPEKK